MRGALLLVVVCGCFVLDSRLDFIGLEAGFTREKERGKKRKGIS
jgi:hypothetical protein